jgi:murein DD-endopeptidase MepM/ murein hydrolase activator NlpD
MNPDWYTISKGHNGIDWATPVGTPVYAMQDGVVSRSMDYSQPGQTDGKIGYGRHVRIQHPQGVSIYGHFSRRDVAEGDVVKAGQQLGLSGGATSDPNSGFSTGAHLHAEYRMDGILNPVPGGFVYNAIDILPLLSGAVIPDPPPAVPIEVGQVVVTLVNLNVRKAPGGSIWATAPKGTRLDVLEIKGDWIRCGWNQWCMSRQNGVDYLRFE